MGGDNLLGMVGRKLTVGNSEIGGVKMVGFFVGMFVGAFIGIVFMCILAVASRADENIEKLSKVKNKYDK